MTVTTDRCVVFDLDGVLVMSEHLWEQGWQSVAADHGYGWLPDDTRTCQRGLSLCPARHFRFGSAAVEKESGAVSVASRAIAAQLRIAFAGR